MENAKYIVCYTEKKADDTVTCYTERFIGFAEAVARYTVFCGAYKSSVTLADIENNQILKQFSNLGEHIVIS